MALGFAATPALWLLIATAPICAWVAWSDLARLKIPNVAVLALVVVFAVLGLLAMSPAEWAWRWAHLAVILVVGMAMNAIGAMGAGDAKFLAAAAPFVALADLALVGFILAGSFLAAFVLHRVARATPLRRLAPGWASWQSGKRFPMGVPLGATLVIYLALAATRV